MQKLSQKLLSSIVAISLVGSNVMPALVYAASEQINENADKINFDAKIKNEHSYVSNIDESTTLDINLSLFDDGYIKDGTITIENNNFKIGDIADNDNIIGISDNKIRLDQIDKNEEVNISVPISFEKEKANEKSYFNKDSITKLDATYIDENGNENIISKTISNNLKWDANVKANISQELNRYLKYDNKTLVSFLIKNGLDNNTLPIEQKTTQVLVPKIEEKDPSKIIVTGNNIDYSYQDQVLIINRKFDNNIVWDSNDEYLITFVYDTQTDSETIDTISAMQVKTASEKLVQAWTDNTSYSIKNEIGNLLETSIVGDTNINKGYLYTNLDRKDDKLETSYNINYEVNIGIVDFVDEIQIKEKNTQETLTKKISVNRENLIGILGEEGSIKVYDGNNQELGILNKDTLQIETNNSNVKFVTNKPINEGNLTLSLEKIINPDLKYTRSMLKDINGIQNSINVLGIYQDNQISNNTIKTLIALEEPESNASISISQPNLSTVVTNENVVITAILEKNDITDALYKNPEMLITLPSQISNVNLKDARLIYEDELVPAIFEAKENTIYLKLEGTQTQYSSVPNINGSVVRILADLTLNNLAVNSEEKIKLDYSNQSNNEVKSVFTPVNIIAPTGFIISNGGKLNQEVSAINDNNAIQIAANDKEKQVTLGGTIVSNLKENTKGFAILGRIPSQNSKTVDGTNQDLNCAFTTSLISEINVSNIDADVFYSSNGEASYDLNDKNNGWTQELINDAKSYLIVAKSEVSPAQRIDFNYKVLVPRNLDYEKEATSVFAVYYDNSAMEGTSKNVISSKYINIQTENIPIIKTSITAEEFYTQEEIKNGDSINEGKYIKYVIHATNTGKKAAENVKVKFIRPNDSSFYIMDYDEENNYYDSYSNNSQELIQSIDKIDAGETKDVEVIVELETYMEENTILTAKAEVTAENMMENSTASFENTSKEGTLELRIYTYSMKEDVLLNNELTYYISLRNNKKETLNNVQIKINIPKYLEIVDAKEGTFDEKERVLTFNVDSVDMYESLQFVAKPTFSEEPNQEIVLKANATFDGLEGEIKSNPCKKTVLDTKGFTATLSSNIEGKMLDTDTVEYYINIKNDSKKSASIEVYNKLPNELKLIGHTVKNGSLGYTKEDKRIDTVVTENLNAGDTLKITIIGKPYYLDSVGQIKEIENKVNIKVNQMDLEVNSIKQQIEGTSNFNTTLTESIQEKNDEMYSISGKVWYDQNGNSKKDENETTIPKSLLKLYDAINNTYIKDEKGKDLEVYTNDNGEYKFDNLSNGKYLVMAIYDNTVYKIANYQVGDYSSNENSDFIESNIGEAITNTITINEENIYNIDLGLMDAENFNITVNNKISKVSVINKEGTKNYEFDVDNAKLNINNIENSTLVIEYLIEIVNQGNIDGYADKIVNTIPDGMNFVSELNESWYVDSNGDAINTSIRNKLIKSGEKEELKLILVRDVGDENIQLIHSSSELKDTSNKYGIEESEINLKERKVKSADLIITNNNFEILQVVGITLIIISTLMLVGIGLYKRINSKD